MMTVVPPEPPLAHRPRRPRPQDRWPARVWWLAVVLAFTAVVAVPSWQSPSAPAPENSSAAVRRHPSTNPPAAGSAKAAVTPHLIQPSARTTGAPFANELNAADGNGFHDVQVLQALLRIYLRNLHSRQGFPIGNDSDLARVLTGRNPMKLVFLPPDHPALTADGRLRDRWGTPYFIHPLGHNDFDIRSAGPDRKMFTDDDLVADPSVPLDQE